MVNTSPTRHCRYRYSPWMLAMSEPLSGSLIAKLKRISPVAIRGIHLRRISAGNWIKTQEMCDA